MCYITALYRIVRMQAQAGLGGRFEEEKTAKQKRQTGMRKGNTVPASYYNKIRETHLLKKQKQQQQQQQKNKNKKNKQTNYRPSGLVGRHIGYSICTICQKLNLLVTRCFHLFEQVENLNIPMERQTDRHWTTWHNISSLDLSAQLG